MNEELVGKLVSGHISGFSIGTFFIPTHTVISVLALSLIAGSMLSVVISGVLIYYALHQFAYRDNKHKEIIRTTNILIILIAFEFVGDIVLLLLAK